MKTINAVREHFKPVAKRVARLFFVLSDLANVDPMYQYSLKWYEMIYGRGLADAEPGDRHMRVGAIIRKFTELLYKNVCRSLFEKDKLLFSFLICMKVMDERNEIDNSESRFLMTGGTWVDPPKPNPTGNDGWISNKMWCTIQEAADKLPVFKGLDESFIKHTAHWEKIYNSQKP